MDQALAKEAAIISMLERFLMGQTRDISGPLGILLRSVEEYPLAAVVGACRAYAGGEVAGHNNSFVPNAVQFIVEVKRHVPLGVWDRSDLTDIRNLRPYPIGGLPPPGTVPLGPVSVDFGYGKIDMTKLTPKEQEAVFRNKRLPRGDSAVPRLKRMG